jgi:DNA modification methylase
MTPKEAIEEYINRIVCGDSVEVLCKLPSESIDMFLFSPPYDAIREYKGNSNFDANALGQQVYRTLKDGGIACVVIGDGTKNFAKSMTSFRLAVDWVDNIGFKLFETCIYNRHGNPGAWWAKRFRVDHEYIFMFLKGERPKTFNKQPLFIESKHAGKKFTGTDRLTDGTTTPIMTKTTSALKCRGTVWRISTSNTEGNHLKLRHPATFPDKLARDLIICFSNANDIVVDPMVGSGTTCVMAAKLGRKYIGIDIAREYVDIANERLQKEQP